MKSVDVNSSMRIDFNKENNKEGPKFKIGDHVRISKCKTFLQKAMSQIGLKTFLLLQNLRIMFRGHILLGILKAKKLLENFTERNCKKTNQKESRVKKVIKRKDDKLYVKWKDYDNLFNSWIDKKRQSINE